MRGRFVGRESEIAELASVVEAAMTRVGPMAGLVVGVPGSGKSRLLAEASERARIKVLRITGYAPEHGVPLTATRDLLRHLSRVPGSGPRLAAVAFGDESPGQTATPLRLFEMAYRCTVESAPAVVAIDDLQWIDDVSAALITYLARAGVADGLPLAILAVTRPSAQTGALRDALVGILPGGGLRELELAPLAESAGIALVRDLVPEMQAAEARRIWERAGGSPFWIRELALDAEAAGPGLSGRFGQLGDDGAALLRAIAVVGRPVQRAELTAMLGWPIPRIEAAVAELAGRGLAVERGGLLAAAHDLVREAAERELPDAVARPLHARLARHLVEVAGDDVALLREALDHAVAGGVPALGIATRIVRAPKRRLIGVSGLGELARVAEETDWLDSERVELEVALAELSTELGDRALELERWIVVAEHVAGFLRARALHAAAKAAYRMGMRESALGLIARARAIGAADRPLAIALDAQESGVLRWLSHRLPEARQLTRRAVDAAELDIAVARSRGPAIDPRLRTAATEALQAAYDLALQEGDEDEQVAVAERLLELVHGELEEFEGRLLLASAYRRAGRTEEAERLARRVRDLATQRLYPAVMVTAGHHLARALYALGRMEEAEIVAAEAEQLSARIGAAGRFLSEIRALRPAISVGRGDWRAGIARLREDIAREPDPHYQLGIHQEIAIWLSRLAGPEEAAEVRSRVAAAQECLEAVGCPRCGRELSLRGAEALARVGDVEAARALMASAAARQARRSYEGRQFLGQAIGALRLIVGPPEQAARSLGRLGRRLTASGSHREALWADLDRGRALESVDRRAAVDVYRSVVDRAAAGGALTDLQVARQRLRSLGARVAPPRPAHGLLGLSHRELEVARLAAAGASNPEIASTLFLSRKTVERHVSVALAKTGARNRTELAARLASLTATNTRNGEMRERLDTHP